MTLSSRMTLQLTPDRSDAALTEGATYILRELHSATLSEACLFVIVTAPSYLAQLAAFQAIDAAGWAEQRKPRVLPCASTLPLLQTVYSSIQMQATTAVESRQFIAFLQGEKLTPAQWQTLNARVALFRSLPAYALWTIDERQTASLETAAPALCEQALVIDVKGEVGVETIQRTIGWLSNLARLFLKPVNTTSEKLSDNATIFLQWILSYSELLVHEVRDRHLSEEDQLLMPLHFLRGDTNATLQQYPNAIYELEKALDYAYRSENDPAILDCQLELARVLMASCRSDKPETLIRAETLVNEYLEHRPENAEALYTRGLVAWRMNRTADARDDWRAAVEREPQSFLMNWMAALAFLQLGDPVQALPYLERAHKAQPAFDECQRALADAYRSVGALDKLHLTDVEDLWRTGLDKVDFSVLPPEPGRQVA
jgi:tetratricopeptide (TPR) repeat protein